VKNLTFEQNIEQIAQNHSEIIRTSTEVQMGVRPEDLLLSGEELGNLFISVRDRVTNSQDGLRLGGVRVYGLTMPIGFAISDFGDHRVTISVIDESFNTIEGIRDYLVEQLIGDNEVYVYSVNVVNFNDPVDFQPQRRYYIRCASIHRSRWEQLTEQAEANRDLHGRLPWDHNPNPTINDMAQQLNRWLGENDGKEKITPQQQIKKHKF
jgi:hypothetical protein